MAEKKKVITLTLAPDLLARLDSYAKARDLSRSAAASSCLTDGLTQGEMTLQLQKDPEFMAKLVETISKRST